MIQDREHLLLEVAADDSVIAADTSVSLGLIVTELVINALKHAFPDNRGGRILVDYRSHGSNWTLSVSDDGVGMLEDPGNARPGLGTSIVEALTKQLGRRNYRCKVASRDQNFGCTLRPCPLWLPRLQSNASRNRT